MKKSLKERYITSAFILLVSTVIVKIISAVYKIPLTAYIGATGRGYFSAAYNLCMPIHAITMGAFPLALTKLVSSYDAKGETDRIKAVRKASKKLFLTVGLAGLIIMLVLAKPYTALISSSPKSIYTILALAPSVFFSCLGACHRAFAEGFLDMKPTAVSQTIEALFKMIFGLLFAKLSMSYFYNSYLENSIVLGNAVSNENEALAEIYPLTSACAMLGAAFGSVVSWIFVSIYTNIKYKYTDLKSVDSSSACTELLTFSAALVGATAIQSLSNFIDTSSIQYCLSLCDPSVLSERYVNCGDDVLSYVFGIYALDLDFKNLIPSIVMALGITAVPAVSSAYECGGEKFSPLLTNIFKYTVILSVAGGTFLSLFSKDILCLFYQKSNPDIVLNGNQLLFLFGVTSLPCAAASTSVFCTQSLGFAKQTIPPFIASALVRVTLNFLLITNNNINILAAAISNFAGFLIILIWNMITICRKTNAKLDIFRIFIKPILCGVISYFVTDYFRMSFYGEISGLPVLIQCALICLLSLALTLLLTKSISLKEIKSLK